MEILLNAQDYKCHKFDISSIVAPQISSNSFIKKLKF